MDLSTLRLEDEIQATLATRVEEVVANFLAREGGKGCTDSSDESDAESDGVESSVEGGKEEDRNGEEESIGSVLTFECARDEAKALAKILIDLVRGCRSELGVS